MKAFYKWWDNDKIVNSTFAAAAETVRFNASDDETKGYAVWRAALEWWGRREVFGKKAYYSGNIRFTDVDVRIQLMKEELEDE